MNIKKLVNHGINAVDKPFEFIQDTFNADDTAYLKELCNNLLKLSQELQDRQAKILAQNASDLDVLISGDLEKRVEQLANISTDTAQVYKIINSLIYDLNKSHNWLIEFQKYREKSVNTNEQLKNLGIAILGRAVELCPIDTGFLRKSGICIYTGDSVIIGFYAPYAVYVHENMNCRHRVGQAKFLENAVQEFIPNKSSWVEILGSDTIAVKITTTHRVYYEHYNN